MSLVNRCLYNRRLKQLNRPLEEFKLEKSDSYDNNRLIQTKDGIPVYLIHCSNSENGEIYAGSINVLTTKGFDGDLKYLVGSYDDKYIKIGDIGHSTMNQGIGTELMRYLDEIAREIRIRKITAWLSPIHLSNHGDRLIYFLKKNGYRIMPESFPNLYNKGMVVTKFL